MVQINHISQLVHGHRDNSQLLMTAKEGVGQGDRVVEVRGREADGKGEGKQALWLAAHGCSGKREAGGQGQEAKKLVGDKQEQVTDNPTHAVPQVLHAF